jgi:hypothetical protein
MRPIARYQSQLLVRRSYKPGRALIVKFRPRRAQPVPLVSVRVPPFAPENLEPADAFTG